jgi:AraC-like DNA-binding protein
MCARILVRKEVLALLQRQILPRVDSASAPLILGYPQVLSTFIRPQPAPLLRSIRTGHTLGKSVWAEEGFNAARFPTLIYVASGEADFRLGITRRMVAQDKRLSPKHGYYIASLPEHSIFIIPPGTPFSDASRPHWERPALAEADSHLLWFHIVPAGVSLHSCSTRDGKHSSTLAFFLTETRLLPLAEVLIEELQNPAPRGEAMARHFLAALLTYLERQLLDSRAPVEDTVNPRSEESVVAGESTPLLRACRYIESHFQYKLTLPQIAAHCYVSPTHLNRLFRSEMKTTVGEYLTKRRLDQARSLLENTDLPIQRVAVLSGFARAEHFNRTFRQHTGISPGAYRRAVKL